MQNQKLSVSAQQHAQHKAVLSALLKQEENRRCADCSSRGPTWASVNLGVFVCLNCSGVHRSLGVHNSKVRSTNLDTWLPEQVAFVKAMGNARANAYWEAQLPSDFRRPPDNDMSALRHFITDKYVHKLYANRAYEPPTIENYSTHPFMAGFAEESSSAAAMAAQQEATAGSAADLAGASEQGGGRGAPPAAATLPAPAAAAAVPAPVPAKPPAAQFDLLSLDDNSNGVAAAACAERAAEATGTQAWDPFSHSTAAFAPPTLAPRALAPAPAATRLDSWDAFASASSQEQQQQQAADPFDLMARCPSRSSSRASMGGTSDAPSVAVAVSAVQQQQQQEQQPRDPFAGFGGDPFVPHAAPVPRGTVPVLHAAAPAPPAVAPVPAPKQPQQPKQPQDRPKLSADHIMSLFGRPGSSSMQPNHTKSASFSAYGSAGAPGLSGMQPPLQQLQQQPMASLTSAPFTYTSLGGIAGAQPLSPPLQPGMRPPMAAGALERRSASAAMGPAMRHSASAPQGVGAEAHGSGLRHPSAVQLQVKHPATVVAMGGGPAREAQAAAKEVFSDFAVF